MKTKQPKPQDPKPKYRHVTDPAQVAALIKIGKWHENKPFWKREYADDGITTKALWLEVTPGSPGEAWLNAL